MKNKVIERVRFAYVYVFFVYMLINQFSLYQRLPLVVNQVAFLTLAACGIGLVAIDFFGSRKMFQVPFCTYLVLFAITCLLTSLIHIQYGFLENLKALVLTVIHMFLMCALTADMNSDTLKKGVRILGETLVIIWTIGCAVSLWHFLTQYSFAFYGSDGDLVRMGYLAERLFGCYFDPNYASLISIVAIAYAVWAAVQTGCRTGRRIYYGFTILIQVLYIILANSRAGILILALVGTALPVLYFAYPKWKGKFRFWKIAATLAAAAVCIPLCFSVADVVREGLSYTPMLFPQEQVQEMISSEETDNPDASAGHIGKVDVTRKDTPSFLLSAGRVKIWTSALKIYVHNPVLGASPRNYLQVGEELLGPDDFLVKKQATIHNGFLAVLTCTGTIGALFILLWFCSSIFVTLRYIIRHRADADEDYQLVLLLTVIILTLSIGSIPLMGIFFTNSILEVIFWCSSGCLLRLISARDSDPGKAGIWHPFIALKKQISKK